jgi:mRNA-degrading endonuclease toxin of MazEF toxin-antitoxin module
MRAIHVARLDKPRPVLVLTRDVVRAHLPYVTVAPITTRVRGLSSEVRLGSANGLDEPCVANCDATVARRSARRSICVDRPRDGLSGRDPRDARADGDPRTVARRQHAGGR